MGGCHLVCDVCEALAGRVMWPLDFVWLVRITGGRSRVRRCSRDVAGAGFDAAS